MIKNEKGLSIVELIIAVAILAIMTTVLTGLCVAGMNFYKTQSADISLQMQSQVVMAQIREYIVDCTNVLEPNTANNEVIKVERLLSNKEENGDKYSKYTHIFSYKNGTLTYQLIKTDRKTGTNLAPQKGELASGIKQFVVSGAKPGSKLISVDMVMRKSFANREWAEKQNIALRNMLY